MADPKTRMDPLVVIQEMRGRVEALRAENERMAWFIESRGYRRCDIPACNCPYWHGGHAERRLSEIEEILEPNNGELLIDAVKRRLGHFLHNQDSEPCKWTDHATKVTEED